MFTYKLSICLPSPHFPTPTGKYCEGKIWVKIDLFSKVCENLASLRPYHFQLDICDQTKWLQRWPQNTISLLRTTFSQLFSSPHQMFSSSHQLFSSLHHFFSSLHPSSQSSLLRTLCSEVRRREKMGAEKRKKGVRKRVIVLWGHCRFLQVPFSQVRR